MRVSSFNDARRLAMGLSGLGDEGVQFVQEFGPHSGKVTGRVSPDGLRGWRIDYDPRNPVKGFHVNWWDYTEGTKRRDWVYGAITIDGATEYEFLELLRHAFGN